VTFVVTVPSRTARGTTSLISSTRLTVVSSEKDRDPGYVAAGTREAIRQSGRDRIDKR